MFYIVPTKYSVILILFFLRQSVIWTILELNRFPQLKLQYMMTTWSLRKGSITYESTSLTNGKKKKADFKKKKNTIHVHRKRSLRRRRAELQYRHFNFTYVKVCS